MTVTSQTRQSASAVKRRTWRTFALGLSIRLAGLPLVYFGDGSPSLVRKAMVVVGVILSVGGIAVLRYLLLSEPLSRLSKRRANPSAGTLPVE